MNSQQAATAIRWAVTAFGATAAGFIAGKGWASAGDVLGVLQSDTFIQGVSAVIALVSLVWGLFRHSEKNQVEATNAMTNVAGVITMDTPAGRQLAKDIPSETVATAGTAKANKVSS